MHIAFLNAVRHVKANTAQGKAMNWPTHSSDDWVCIFMANFRCGVCRSKFVFKYAIGIIIQRFSSLSARRNKNIRNFRQIGCFTHKNARGMTHDFYVEHATIQIYEYNLRFIIDLSFLFFISFTSFRLGMQILRKNASKRFKRHIEIETNSIKMLSVAHSIWRNSNDLFYIFFCFFITMLQIQATKLKLSVESWYKWNRNKSHLKRMRERESAREKTNKRNIQLMCANAS